MICLSVDVEGWDHYLWRSMKGMAPICPNSRLFDSYLLRPLRNLLEILEKCGAISTFFIAGEIVESCPEMVEEIHNSGHEIASHGYRHVHLTKVNENDFKRMEKMNMDLMTKTTGEKPRGFRAPMFDVNTQLINSLESIGYVYDSSVIPSLKIPGWFGFPDAPIHPYHPSEKTISKENCERRHFYEVPLAVFPFPRLPACGGWFLRNIGVNYIKATARYLLSRNYPVVLYVHLQDLSLIRPRVDNMPFHSFRNCGRYAVNGIENILRNIKARKISISEMVSTWVPT